MAAPLADRIRPQTLDDVVGQEHLLAPGMVLRRMVETGSIPNLIFYGPSGVGKTTVASIIAKKAGKKLVRLNGTTASTQDIRDAVAARDTIDGLGGVLLYLDEIQYLNKKQQQSLLECIEDGSVTLIASTTENPYFYVYGAVLSRSTVFEFKPSPPRIRRAPSGARSRPRGRTADTSSRRAWWNTSRRRAAATCARQSTRSSCSRSRRAANGRLPWRTRSRSRRRARCATTARATSTTTCSPRCKNPSAVRMKTPPSTTSRGCSRPGDLLSPCRRLLVIASEDIGLAYPMAIAVTKACVDAAVQIGLPEAQLRWPRRSCCSRPRPKSNASCMAIEEAMADVRAGKSGPPPRCLQNKHFDGADVKNPGQFYRYPHDYPNHYLRQQYLPDALRDRVYYRFGDNKTEQAAKAYREKLLREAAPEKGE